MQGERVYRNCLNENSCHTKQMEKTRSLEQEAAPGLVTVSNTMPYIAIIHILYTPKHLTALWMVEIFMQIIGDV